MYILIGSNSKRNHFEFFFFKSLSRLNVGKIRSNYFYQIIRLLKMFTLKRVKTCNQN